MFETGDEVTRALTGHLGATVMKVSELTPGAKVDAIVLSTKSMRNALSGPADQPAPNGREKDFVPTVSAADFDAALERAKNDGTRLVLLPDHQVGAEMFAKALNDRKIATYSGLCGNRNAPWFGSWNFVRKHWLLDGLPTDCAMDWRYGISAFSGAEWLKEDPKGTHHDGMLIDAPGIEVFAGYGADHSPRVGVAGCVIPYGRGEIVLYCLPQMVRSLEPGTWSISPVIAQRMLANALAKR